MAWKNARLVAYDISDDKRRRHLARYLLGKGLRLQESVFLVDVHRDALKQFVKQLEEFRDGDDKIDIAPLCGNCRDRSIRLGKKEPSAIIILGDDDDWGAAARRTAKKPGADARVDKAETQGNLENTTTTTEKPSISNVTGEPGRDGEKGV